MLRGYNDRERGAREAEVFLRGFADDAGRDALITHLRSLECSETAALSSRLKEIACPTAIVWGARDPFLDVGIGERLHYMIPNSRFEVIARAKHFLPQEVPHKVASAVEALLRRS
jgi:pimeloyl-ACP methyl ester carboxylesterase